MSTTVTTDDITPITRGERTPRYRRCRPRTSVERLLLALLLVLSVLCAILILFFTRQSNPTLQRGRRNVKGCTFEACRGVSCKNICLTEECIEAAASMLKSIDFGAEPCDDFYQFACGRWHHHHSLPRDRSHFNTFSIMKEELTAKLRDLLEDPVTESDYNATIKAKDLYAACMNETIIEALREQPLITLLEELGGWPVIQPNWNEDDFDWVVLVAKLRIYNNHILIGQWVGPDGKNSSLHIMQLDQTDLGLPSRDYYLQRTQQLEAYERFMIDIAELLDATHDHAASEMKDVIEFETELANLTIPSEARRNYSAMYNKIALSELQTQLPLINWTTFFSIAMPLEISDEEEVVVYSVSYFKAMSELVKITPKRVVANYILWRFIHNRVSNLDKRFLNKQQEYFNALYGTQDISPRWKICTAYVNKYMGMALGSMFVRKHFNEESKEMAEEMIEDIKKVFLDVLEEVDWMDNATKETARKKAEMISPKIGFPEYIVDPERLNEDYEGLEFKRDAYFESVIQNLKFNSLKEQLYLRTPVNRSEWATSPAVINAFYTRSKNFISFPAGILQPPLYHQNYLRALNYGGIGVVIGHEITHGFDDKGRQFDQYGNLKQWWNPEALDMFQEKAECMINQYGNYVMSDINMKVNGINTLGENIADNGGVKQAFKAYKTWLSRNGPESILPGLNLTYHQLFFLSYAQIWCGVMRPEAAVNNIRTNSHSPGRFRVIGALSNSEDFNEAFDCPLNSNMNPSHKCEVW